MPDVAYRYGLGIIINQFDRERNSRFLKKKRNGF
jgi:hypothetical protein